MQKSRVLIQHESRVTVLHKSRVFLRYKSKEYFTINPIYMSSPSEKLAQSLDQLRTLQNKSGLAVVTSGQLSRTHLERLVKNGFLQEVLKGWYISSRPDSLPGDTTTWYTSYWHFVVAYATVRFGGDWSLSADQSLALHTGNSLVPSQLIIRSPKANNNIVTLLHGTSLLLLRADLPDEIVMDPLYGLRLYKLPEAIVTASPGAYQGDALDIRTGLSMIKDSSDVLHYLAGKGMSTRAGRVSGAFRSIGRKSIADDIKATMKSLNYDIREEDPFEVKIELPGTASPYVSRLQLMWNNMRGQIAALFPEAPPKSSLTDYLATVEAQYKLDAYHSLSIEGYSVTEELIEKVRSGEWRPDTNQTDMEQRNALAARGYWQAFQEVKKSVQRVLEGENAGKVAEADHRNWYRQLFQPCVTAGIIKAVDLSGYRSSQVYIRGSLHTPLNPDALRDAMPELFRLLENEPHAGVRAVLGHFIFTFIHPYMDGNGRVGRFLLNVMLASGGYDWLIIPVERRKEYMAALEKASVDTDITDFTRFIISLL